MPLLPAAPQPASGWEFYRGVRNAFEQSWDVEANAAEAQLREDVRANMLWFAQHRVEPKLIQ